MYIEHQNDRLQGLSLVEQHIAHNKKGYASSLEVGRLVGKSSPVANFDLFEFEVEFEGVKTTSTVRVEAGGVLHGSSVAKIQNPDLLKHKKTDLRYSWIARRFKD